PPSDARPPLERQIHHLPRRYREVIVLCYSQGMTKDQAALTLGTPAGTISTWLARARQMLAAAMTKAGASGSISAALVVQLLNENVNLPAQLAKSTVHVGIGGVAGAPVGIGGLAEGK